MGTTALDLAIALDGGLLPDSYYSAAGQAAIAALTEVASEILVVVAAARELFGAPTCCHDVGIRQKH